LDTIEARSWRPLRLSIVATLILLTLQLWTGDFVNVFVTTSAASAPSQSIGGFFQAVMDGGLLLIWHGMEGFLILLSAVGVLAVSLRYQRRSVKIGAALGLVAVVVAGLGGYLFVLSGFTAGGNTMQMGGASTGAYALYFITLYYKVTGPAQMSEAMMTATIPVTKIPSNFPAPPMLATWVPPSATFPRLERSAPMRVPSVPAM
jgi:hypothetical protein